MTDAAREGNRRRVGTAIAYSGALWAVCSIPGHAIPTSILWSWDKVWHLIGFALLVIVWRRAGRAQTVVAVSAFFYGVAIEVWQHLAPIGRFFDPLDILANTAGIAVGALAFAMASRRIGRRQSGRPSVDAPIGHSDQHIRREADEDAVIEHARYPPDRV